MNDRINDSSNLANAIKDVEKELERTIGLTIAVSIMEKARKYLGRLNLDDETRDRLYLGSLKRAYLSRTGNEDYEADGHQNS